MKVKELMTKTPTCISPEQPLREAARLMKQNDCGSLPVQDASGRLLGMITDRDIVVRAVAEGRNGDCTVKDVMTKDPATVGPDDDVSRVEQIMAERQVRRVPVVDGSGKAVGVVAQADLARASDRNVSSADLAKVVEQVSRAG